MQHYYSTDESGKLHRQRVKYYYRASEKGPLIRCQTANEAIEKAQGIALLYTSPDPCAAEVYRGVSVSSATLIRRYWRDADVDGGVLYRDY